MDTVLTTIIFLPALFALLMGLFRVPHGILRLGAMLSALWVFVLALQVAFAFDPTLPGMQFVREVPWIANYGIDYHVGVDALSLPLLLMTALLMPIIYLYMWHYRKEGYWYSMLMLQTGVSGAILSLDLILFYLFWETMLLPIFIMIGRFGHIRQQLHAMKILIYTVAGSMAMLFAIIYLGYQYYALHGVWNFSLDALATLDFDPRTSLWLAGGFLLAFAIKIPLLGFHTWMPQAYGSAPTPSLVILSAIMAKLGVYGLWRFGYGIFPETLEYYTPFLVVLAIAGLIYYAVDAVMQSDLRRMFAFSSGSHLSLITLGVLLLNIYAWSGSLYFIVTHALASAGIFLMVGMLFQRAKSVTVDELGGIATVAPRFAFFFAFFALCMAGLPGTGGFVAELLIILGAFQHNLWLGLAAATTVLAAILYVFWMLQRTLFGPRSEATERFRDLNGRELLLLTPLALLLLITGLVPDLFLSPLTPQLQQMLAGLTATLGGLL